MTHKSIIWARHLVFGHSASSLGMEIWLPSMFSMPRLKNATCGRICGKLWPPPQGSLSGRFTAYFLPPADSRYFNPFGQSMIELLKLQQGTRLHVVCTLGVLGAQAVHFDPKAAKNYLPAHRYHALNKLLQNATVRGQAGAQSCDTLSLYWTDLGYSAKSL